jgi:hypothetical protein
MCGRQKGMAIVLMGLVVMWGCFRKQSVEPQGSGDMPFWTDLPAPSPFQLSDNLACRTVLSTHKPLVNAEFRLVGISGERPIAVGKSNRETMSILQAVGNRLVLQVAGQDPGSVVTLSLDKGNGAFALQWSGWDPHGKLSVGAQRGFCRGADIPGQAIK